MNYKEVVEKLFSRHRSVQSAGFSPEAYKPGLDAMREYTYENKRIVRDAIAAQLPDIRVTDSEATYLLWIDCSALTHDTTELTDFLRKETGLILSRGGQYGSGGEAFLRLNAACPRAILEDGVGRLIRGIGAYREKGEE